LYWEPIVEEGEVVGIVCPDCLTLREERAIRAEKARALRRLKRGLPLTLLALATVAAAAWMTATALAQVPDQNRQCSTFGLIRISDLQANQLVDCDGAREVASDWLFVRWFGQEASFSDTVAEGASGLGDGWDCVETRTDPASVDVVCQPPPDVDGAQFGRLASLRARRWPTSWAPRCCRHRVCTPQAEAESPTRCRPLPERRELLEGHRAAVAREAPPLSERARRVRLWPRPCGCGAL
jgi:hypothetical protein